MKRHISNAARCPFYRSEDDLRVVCEGPARGSSLHVVLRSKEQKKRYTDKYCCDDYGRCAVAQSLFTKYGGST